MVNGNQQLSDGWTWVTIGEIAKSINPGFPSGRHNQENLGAPHMRPMNISRNGDIDLSVVKYVEVADYSPLLQGDVLFNNTNSPELVGKTTYIRKDTNWAYSNHMTRIRLNREVAYPAWVANTLHYLFLDGFFKLNCRHHVNQASVGSGFLSQNVKIPLPPLPEQERIVAKIEELFTQLEAGASALERVQAGLRRYKASVLKAAVEGKLLPSGHGDAVSVPGELPEGWQWTTIGELAKVGTGSTPLRSKEKYWKNGTIPWVTSGALNDLQVIQANEFVTEIALKETNVKIFPAGTLLVAMYGEGKTRGKVSELMIDATTNQACAALVFDKEQEENKPFIKIFFQKYYEDIRFLSSGGVQPNLNLSIIKNIRLPLPPLEEQRRIVAEVERRLSVAREVETVVEKALARSARLRQSALKHAFEGKLT